MSQPVASTSALPPPPPPPRPSSTSRRLPGAWARPTPSSSSSANRPVDRTSSGAMGAQAGGVRAAPVRRSSDVHGRAPKRPRTSSSLEGSEQRARQGTSSPRSSGPDERRAAGAARPGVETSLHPGQVRQPRPQPVTAPVPLVSALGPVAPTSELGGERFVGYPAPPRPQYLSPPSPTRLIDPRPVNALYSRSLAAQLAPPDLPRPAASTYPPAPHPHRPRPPRPSTSSSSSSTLPSAASSSRLSVADTRSRFDSRSSSQASSQVSASSSTPSYIRDRYAAPSTSAPRPAAPPTRRRRPPLLESTRGPAPLALLFDGQDVPQGSTRPPPHRLGPAPAPATAAAPVRPRVPPSLLFMRNSGAEATERARRVREAAEAEERRRRDVWTAAAQVSRVAVAPAAPRSVTSQISVEEPQRAPELPREQVAPSKLTVEDEREVRALFSPPPSPSPPPPPPPVVPSPERSPGRVLPLAPAAAHSRTASPELCLGLDNSPRQPRPPPPSAHPLSPTCPSSTTSAERTDRCRSRSPFPPGVDADERSTTTESAAALSAVELSREPEGSPELVMGMSVEHEKPSRPGGTGPSRRSQQVAAAAKGKGKWMKRRNKGKAWTMLEPEDTWWTRDLDDKRAVAVGAPEDWVVPEQPGWRALDHAGSAEQSLELTVHELVLPTSVVPDSALETGRCRVDLHISLHHTLEDAVACEREMRVGLVVGRVHSTDPASRSFRLEHPRPIPLYLDPASLDPRASSLFLTVAVTIGNEQLAVRHVVAVADPVPPFSALLPFQPRPAGQAYSLADHNLVSRTSAPLVAGIAIALAAQPVPRLAPPSPTDITSLLSARLERLALHREAPSGVWIPDAVALRSPATSVVHERHMPRLEGGAERPAFDFLTKVPHAPGELCRVFAHDSIETTRAAASSKDEEITRSSMTANEKLLTRMQARWCLLNPYPPTVYHRERACWVHYAPVISRFDLRSTLVLHLVQHLLAHKLVTQSQLREIVRAVDREVERVEEGDRPGYDEWRRDVEWEKRRA
ncbi:hypothetical protein JCM8208_004751 [Rhodotorula glutinis]